MIATRWNTQEVPNVDGLVCANGESFDVVTTGLGRACGRWNGAEWLNVAVLAEQELCGGQYILKCGEAFEHGSIGVVVLECLQSHAPVWIFVSDQSNPFDEISIKGSTVLVLSTTGAVLRFPASWNSTELPPRAICYYGGPVL